MCVRVHVCVCVCMCVCVCVCVCVCESPPLSPLGSPGVHGPSAAGKDPLLHHRHPPHETQEEPQPQRYIYCSCCCLIPRHLGLIMGGKLYEPEGLANRVCQP